MIVIAALVFGGLLGWRTARQRGGQSKDQLHYAAAFGIAFAVLGMMVTIFIDRLT
jgi:heme A synthase